MREQYVCHIPERSHFKQVAPEVPEAVGILVHATKIYIAGVAMRLSYDWKKESGILKRDKSWSCVRIPLHTFIPAEFMSNQMEKWDSKSYRSLSVLHRSRRSVWTRAPDWPIPAV